ncbi:DNA-3-methyladenine glycosylase I [Shimia thalassica]|uniref:DNA-3-methyladenine glycosylase I n=1 Tax=Shimia thalassica TaxID=1715693 RepID=UPI001C0A4813|nr:DNA-3-methyladenine glycosylase I [Shimia thalassica]MBU2944571.1 DNA-3-methyladenine glycosylase I [Shimia thalassica]MDO6502083.1 DNA-3-methyladenine glycosylase I [Shimia thalassica]MDO6520194.1 DNA-3-methyladenine glycosylase I [Shimia thalassica]MDP2492813.1 DNA-3-methyladenine glycosylase I [Shimia thalassica]
MRSFQDLYDIAADRKGGPEALEAMIPKPDPNVSQLPEDRWLSLFTKGVFQAGFSWKVIEAKWEGFEEAFHGFDVDRCAFLHDEDMDRLMSNAAIVRNGPKIRTVIENAHFLQGLRADGGAGKVIGGWPSEDFIGLLEMLKKNGSRLGGMTGQYAMRFAGRDAFILSRDVSARLIAEGVIDKPATSKTAMKAVQGAFNTWMQQSGRGLTEVSRVLAFTV